MSNFDFSAQGKGPVDRGAEHLQHVPDQEGSFIGRAINMLPNVGFVTFFFGSKGQSAQQEPVAEVPESEVLREPFIWVRGDEDVEPVAPVAEPNQPDHLEVEAPRPAEEVEQPGSRLHLDEAEEARKAALKVTARAKFKSTVRKIGKLSIYSNLLRAQGGQMVVAPAGSVQIPAALGAGVVAGVTSTYQAVSGAVSSSLDIPNTETAQLIKKGLVSIVPALHQLHPESSDALLSIYSTAAYPVYSGIAFLGSIVSSILWGSDYRAGAHDVMRGLFGLSPERTRREMLVERYPRLAQGPSTLQCVLQPAEQVHGMTHGMLAKAGKLITDVQTAIANRVARPALSQAEALELSGNLLIAIGASAKASLTQMAEGDAGSQTAKSLLSMGKAMECWELLLKPRIAGCLRDANAALNAKYVKCLVVQPATETTARIVTEVTLGALIDRLGPKGVLGQLKANNPELFEILEGPVGAFLASSAQNGLVIAEAAQEINKAVIMAHILTYVDHINRVKNALYDEQGNLSFHQILASKSLNSPLAQSFTALCSLMTGKDVDSEATQDLENQFRNGLAVYELYKLSSGGVVGALDSAEALSQAAERDGVSPETIASAKGWIDSARKFWALPPSPAVAHSINALNQALAQAGSVVVSERSDPALNEAVKDVAKKTVAVASVNQKAAVGVAALSHAPTVVREAAAMGPAVAGFAMHGNADALLASLFKMGAAFGRGAVSVGMVLGANRAGQMAADSAIDAGVVAANPAQRMHDALTRGCVFMDALTSGLQAPYAQAQEELE